MPRVRERINQPRPPSQSELCDVTGRKYENRLAKFIRNGLLHSRHLDLAQKMKITDVLRAEHTVFHNLFDHIETTVPRHKLLAQVKSVADTLESLLRAHSMTEDELFIAPLEHYLEQIGQRDIFHEEHEEIDRQLLEVQKARSLKAARQNLLKAVAASRKHFDKEERVVFPLAERVLKARTLSDLGDEWMKRREAALR